MDQKKEIEEFNRIRQILFRTFNKGERGQIDAFEYLEGYKKTLNQRSYTGLKAELGFFKNYRKEFQLTTALDCGDHADFSGLISKEAFRFDVTTNADYKKLKDYEPFQKDSNAKYKIALVDRSGCIEELIDINFPFCPECEQGRMIDTVVLLPENYSDKGESKWTNDQALIGICNNCQYFEEQSRISTHFLSDFNTKINNALEYERDKMEYQLSMGQNPVFDTTKIVQSHVDMILPYLRKQFDKSIMALCDISCKIINPAGDGYNYLKVWWKKNLKILYDYILDEYDIDLE
ncbi:MAG: hypothetical protein PVH61_17405 [Candidatus Aminicenantes bacterium]|jgi:hypothetical protein